MESALLHAKPDIYSRAQTQPVSTGGRVRSSPCTGKRQNPRKCFFPVFNFRFSGMTVLIWEWLGQRRGVKVAAGSLAGWLDQHSV